MNYNVETFTISETNQLFFVSDLHFFHKRIVEFTGRPTTFEKLTPWLIQQCNSTIPKQHATVLHLGDMFFGCTTAEAAAVLEQLNGNWWFVLGNHDNPAKLQEIINLVNNKTGSKHRILGWYHRLLVKVPPKEKNQKMMKKLLVLCHFPIEEWDGMDYGAYMIHGHCVDYQTEILTESGWKFRKDLLKSDKVYSLNKETELLELQNIDEIVDLQYTGKVYSLSSNRIDFRFTEGHTVLYKTLTNIYKEKQVKDFKSTLKLPVTAFNSFNNKSTLSDALIKLYVYLVSDGSIKTETNLCRLIVKKEHKHKAIISVLTELKIDYKTYPQKNGSTSYNFYMPQELLDWNIKGLDDKIFTFSPNQVKTFIEAYINADGTKNGNSVVIYTSKKEEADRISYLCAINNYRCTVYSRDDHGFSTGTSYQLSCTKNLSFININPSKRMEISNVSDEPFWCIKTKHKNFIMRRNGKVHITGNCHGGGSEHSDYPLKKIPNRFDVGIDNSHTYTPFTYEELRRCIHKGRNKITKPN